MATGGKDESGSGDFPPLVDPIQCHDTDDAPDGGAKPYGSEDETASSSTGSSEAAKQLAEQTVDFRPTQSGRAEQGSSDRAQSNKKSLRTFDNDSSVSTDSNKDSIFDELVEEKEILAVGAFGRVYKAKHKKDRVYYAIKEIPVTEATCEQFESEIRILATLKHDHVVRYHSSWPGTCTPCDYPRSDLLGSSNTNKSSAPQVLNIDMETYDLGSENGDNNGAEQDFKQNSGTATVAKQPCLYIQMELCEKNTLRDIIDNRGQHGMRDSVLKLFKEICQGLAYIHKENVIHRNLTPANIFIGSDKKVKIGGFGLATLASSKYSRKVECTLYAAPEMTNDEYDEKVDLHSLGVTLFEMCYRPLDKSERENVLTKLRDPSVDFPNDFGDDKTDERDVIRWLLKSDPAGRPTSQELLHSKYMYIEHYRPKSIKYFRDHAQLSIIYKTRTLINAPGTLKYHNLSIHFSLTCLTQLHLPQCISAFSQSPPF